MRKTLAAGADKLVFLQDDAFENLDSYSTASVLADAIRKIGEYDLILTGRQAGDWDFGQVGLILGELLGLPCVSLAREIKVKDGNVLAKKIVLGGYEEVKAKMPALVTASNEVGELRYISKTRLLAMLRGAAPVPTWKSGDFVSAGEKLQKMNIVELSSPPDMRRDCEILKGSTPDEKAEKLAAIFKSFR